MNRVFAVAFLLVLVLSPLAMLKAQAQLEALTNQSVSPLLTNHYTEIQFRLRVGTRNFGLGFADQLQANSGTIVVTFPAGFGVPATISTSNITVNGVNPPSVVVSGQVVTITTPVDLTRVLGLGDGYGTVIFSSAARIRLPGTAGNYTYTVYTSSQTTPRTSSSFAVTATTTTVSGGSVTPNTSVENRSAAYTINFQTGLGGFLTSASKIYLDFPVGTTVPNGNISGVTLGGQSVTTSGNSTTRRITLDVPGDVDNSSFLTTVFGKSSGIKNPGAGNYQVEISTSTETTEVNSGSYSISSASVLSFSTIQASNDTVNAISSYEIEFVLSNTGALSAAALDKIKVTFPAGFTVPGTIAASSVSIENLTSGFSDNPVAVAVSGQVVTLTPSLDFADSDEMKVTFLSAANIRNYAIAGNYTFTIGTFESNGSTVIDATVNSNPFTLKAAATTVSNASVALSNTTASAANVTYTIAGTVGEYGRLVAGTSTFTVTFPSATNYGTVTTTVNGQSASFSRTGDVITITVPGSVSIANNGSFTLVVNGVTNPTAGSYTANLYTSVEGTSKATQPYNCGTSSVNLTTVALSATGVNRASTYTLTVTGTNLVGGVGDYAVVTFPEGTYLPATISTANVTISGRTPESITVNQTNRTVTIVVPTAPLLGFALTNVVINVAAGIRNPPIAGTYRVSMYTSQDLIPDNSNNYSVIANTTSVTAVTATATSPVANGTAAQYQISFTTGANGKLVGGIAAGSSTITVTFPAGFTVPASISTSNILVEGIQASAVSTNVGSRTVTITLGAGQEIDNSTVVDIDISSGAALLKAGTAGTRTVNVRTSSETTNSSNTNNLTLTGASALYVNSVAVSPNYTNAQAAYTIKFTPGTGDGLAIGNTIEITFPANTFVPSSVATTQILVNSTYPSVGATGSGQTLTVTTPVALAEDVQATVQISSAAGIINPSSAGTSYSLNVKTPTEGPTASPVYTITTAPVSTVSAASVTLSSYTASNANTSYTTSFSTGTYGRLVAGTSKITVTFPAGTNFGTLTSTVNGVAATISRSGQVCTITVPGSVSISNSSSVTVVVGGVTNPATQASYQLSIKTSVETTAVSSGSYTISNTAPVTINTVSFTDYTVNAPSVATIQFTVAGSGGALTSGSGTVTIVFPSGFTVPASNEIELSSIQINGVNISGRSSNTNTNTITLTTGVNIANGAAVTVSIAAGADLLNQSEPGDYTLSIRTSAQPVSATSATQTFIESLTTQIIGLSVSATPSTTLTPVNWTWSFTTGARGRIRPGVGKIYFDFDQSVFTLGTIPTSTVKINGTSVAAVAIAGSVVEITVPASVTIGVSEAATVQFLSGAGIKVDPALGKRRPGSDARIAGTNNYSAYTSPETTPSSYQGNPLPVILSYFTVIKDETTGKPKLDWETYTELNNYRFFVYRLTDLERKAGRAGRPIGEIRGNGTSYEPHQYSLLDSTVSLAGRYHYDLYQEDYDSERKLIASASFVLDAPESFSLDAIYPNPFNPVTNIKFSVREKSPVQIQVFDVTGRLISTLVDGALDAGVHTVTFNGRLFSSGLYLLRFRAGGKVMVKRMTLIK